MYLLEYTSSKTHLFLGPQKNHSIRFNPTEGGDNGAVKLTGKETMTGISSAIDTWLLTA
jgi:hypothetical protein